MSYRGNKTIRDILVPSKLKTLKNDQSESPAVDPENSEFGSFGCAKLCKFCKDFLESPVNITSFHTDQQFDFKHKLDCKVPFLIYKIDDLQCKKTSIGSTEDMAKRWSNHKSHIRKSVKSCEIASHFSDSKVHDLDNKSAIGIFDDNLKKILRVTLIDKVDVTGVQCAKTRTRLLKEKEEYWQHQLKTLEMYGGFNKRGARKETSAKSYTT